MKKGIGTEKEYLYAVTDMFDDWVRQEMFKTTETYKNWQHDKGSFGYGYIMALKAAIQKLAERIELLK